MTLLYVGTEHALIWGRYERQPGQAPVVEWQGRLDIGKMPSFMAFLPQQRRAVAIAEGDDRIVSLAVAKNGALELLSTQPCPGGPAYVAVSRDGRWALAVSYGSGEVRVFPLNAEGMLGSLSCVTATGKYSHCVVLDEVSRRVYVPSKGTDSVYVGAFDDQAGTVSPLHITETPAGTGPRHLVLSPDGASAYLANENDGTLIVFQHDDRPPFLHAKLQEPAVPRPFQARDSGADVHVSADGRFVYMSVRGQDNLAMFARDQNFTCVQHIASGGQVPRNFCILDPNTVVVANQESKSLAFFARDQGRGTLGMMGRMELDERVFWVGSPSSR